MRKVPELVQDVSGRDGVNAQRSYQKYAVLLSFFASFNLSGFPFNEDEIE